MHILWCHLLCRCYYFMSTNSSLPSSSPHPYKYSWECILSFFLSLSLSYLNRQEVANFHQQRDTGFTKMVLWSSQKQTGNWMRESMFAKLLTRRERHTLVTFTCKSWVSSSLPCHFLPSVDRRRNLSKSVEPGRLSYAVCDTCFSSFSYSFLPHPFLFICLFFLEQRNQTSVPFVFQRLWQKGWVS